MTLSEPTDPQREFGGRWTLQKLAALESYLPAYTRILGTNDRAKYLKTMYVDAFAGSGKLRFRAARQDRLFGESRDEYHKGSATRALEVSPEFNRYIFIESKPDCCSQLLLLRDQFPEKRDRIEIHNQDANAFLVRWCANTDWRRWRAVVILDSFAMDVPWSTVEQLASTRAVDLWWLFPCGAFNRLLTRRKKPRPAWAAALTRICGSSSWEQRFYTHTVTEGLFGRMHADEKHSTFAEIEQFLHERLASVFAGVAQRPLLLVNSNNSPIFMLFFAASNPRAAGTATRIANWVIQQGGSD